MPRNWRLVPVIVDCGFVLTPFGTPGPGGAAVAVGVLARGAPGTGTVGLLVGDAPGRETDGALFSGTRTSKRLIGGASVFAAGSLPDGEPLPPESGESSCGLSVLSGARRIVPSFWQDQAPNAPGVGFKP